MGPAGPFLLEMANVTDTGNTGGQAAGDSIGTTLNAPEGSTATVGNGQTTPVGPDAGAVESFFDPSSIQDKPELQSAYKQMQGAFTKGMQAVRTHKQKIEAYDRFASNPIDTVRQLAQQYGLRVVQTGGDEPKDWNPQSWDDVMARAKQEVLKEMEPVVGELRNLKKQSVESHLDSLDPTWRTYEPDMIEALQRHPSLANDPDKLYRISVPPEVLEARAVAKAMQKVRGATEHGQVAGGSTAKKVSAEPTGPLSFEQAVEVARKRASAGGLSRPS